MMNGLDTTKSDELARVAKDVAARMGTRIDWEALQASVARSQVIGERMVMEGLMMLAAYPPNEWMQRAYARFGDFLGRAPLTEDEKRNAIQKFVSANLIVEHEQQRWPYEWFWRKRLGHRKGQACRVTARGRMNSIAVEFPDGHRVITSGFAVRRRKV